MNRKSEKQLLHSILRWSNYLLETGQMSEVEVEKLLGEGLVKRLGHALKTGAKATAGYVGNSFKHVFGDIGKFMHDMVLANKGIAKLLKCISALKPKVKNLEDVKLVVLVERTVYPIYELDIPGKFSKALILSINPDKSGTVNGAITLGNLMSIMQAKKVKNLSSWVEGVVIGVEKGAEKTLDEASKKPSKKPAKKPSTKSSTKSTTIDTTIDELKSVETESGDKYDLAANKLIDVVTNGKDIIAFKFDVTEDTKKARKAKDELFT